MPRKGKKGEYTGNACHRCHKQKVKCSRERPCRNCALVNRPCTYAVRDRKVTVPESYLKNLEGGLISPLGLAGATKRFRIDSNYVSQQICGQDTILEGAHRSFNALVENSTAELFVSKLKQIQRSNSSPWTFGMQSETFNSPDRDPELKSAQPSTYEYFALKFDTSHAKCTFKLPPYSYAVHLLNQFTIFLGHDWHWFRVRRFRRRLDNTYMIMNSGESKDRIWLCQLLVVFALGESVNASQQPEITLDPNENASQSFGHITTPVSSPPPGTEFFEQAMGLLNVPYEELSIDHIETVNLVALYSYSLNRQKTAYMYAGASARMCNMIQLHQVSVTLDCSPVEREHRKRVWWTTFCIDRMASTQMGLVPALHVDQVDLDYPTQKGLLPEDNEEFADPDHLTARIQLTIIQANNSSIVCNFRGDDTQDIHNILRPMLQRLGAWRAGLPPHMALELEDGMPESMRQMPAMRSLASLYLRFNQCLILLLRPFILKQIACIFSKEELNASQKDLEDLNNTCLKSARSNLHILIDLRMCGLLVRLGFMENLHLFTSLMILCLAMSINSRCPRSFHEKPDDAVTYEAGKGVLRDMVQAGNIAARGHENMLKDVENLGGVIATHDDMEVNLVAGQWDVDVWMTQLFESKNSSNFF